MRSFMLALPLTLLSFGTVLAADGQAKKGGIDLGDMGVSGISLKIDEGIAVQVGDDVNINVSDSIDVQADDGVNVKAGDDIDVQLE